MQVTIAGEEQNIAVITSEEVLITDAQSALDLMAAIQYETGCSRIVLDRSCVSPDFFRLGTGLAGEILQRYANYHIKLAVVGDFSEYTSKPLRDFIYESNQGKDFFFAPTREQAIGMLSGS